MRSQIEDDLNEVSSMYAAHEPRDLHFGDEPTRTRQEFADECDINVLMRRYEKTGVISHVSQREPMYLDLTEVPSDLQTALNIVMEADRAFMTLPAAVRREFDNDPVKFVAFASDPANIDKLREWDLAPPAPEPPIPVVVPEPPSGGSGA